MENPDPDTLATIEKLMELHDRVKATNNRPVSFRESLRFLNSLLLPCWVSSWPTWISSASSCAAFSIEGLICAHKMSGQLPTWAGWPLVAKLGLWLTIRWANTKVQPVRRL
jgi:hypothetical protein